MNQKITALPGPSFYSPSRLLVPDFLLDVYNQKKKKFGNLKALFHYIVNHKHRVYNNKSMSRGGKICYQPQYLMLHKKDFFPNVEDWERFRTQANLQRISMTFLFVLILMDWEGFEEKGVGVPRIPEKIQLNQTLTITDILIYLEIQRLIL